jgi:hypothetical protein
MESDATGLLIIRMTVERGSATPLRAYIREADDVSDGFGVPITVSDVEAALEIVRAFLERAVNLVA